MVPQHSELNWIKASEAGADGVELAALPDGGVAIRDSKDPDGPVLVYTQVEFVAFLDGVQNREFDHFA